MISTDRIREYLKGLKGADVDVRIPSSTGRSFVATCPNPAHVDHKPSCVGDLETGAFKCLGCGFEGEIPLV